MPRRAPEALGGIARQGRGREAARFSQGLGCPFEKTRPKPSERRAQAAWGGLLTRPIRALALRAPMASKSAPGGFVFGYFLLAMHKFAWSEFEQPIGWPAGRKPGTVFVAKVSRLPVREPALNRASQRDTITTNRIRDNLTLVPCYGPYPRSGKFHNAPTRSLAHLY